MGNAIQEVALMNIRTYLPLLHIECMASCLHWYKTPTHKWFLIAGVCAGDQRGWAHESRNRSVSHYALCATISSTDLYLYHLLFDMYIYIYIVNWFIFLFGFESQYKDDSICQMSWNNCGHSTLLLHHWRNDVTWPWLYSQFTQNCSERLGYWGSDHLLQWWGNRTLPQGGETVDQGQNMSLSMPLFVQIVLAVGLLNSLSLQCCSWSYSSDSPIPMGWPVGDSLASFAYQVLLQTCFQVHKEVQHGVGFGLYFCDVWSLGVECGLVIVCEEIS